MPRFVGVYLKDGQAAPLALAGIYPLLFSKNRWPGILSTDGRYVYGIGKDNTRIIPSIYNLDRFEGNMAVAQASFKSVDRPYESKEHSSFKDHSRFRTEEDKAKRSGRSIIAVSGQIDDIDEVLSEFDRAWKLVEKDHVTTKKHFKSGVLKYISSISGDFSRPELQEEIEKEGVDFQKDYRQMLPNTAIAYLLSNCNNKDVSESLKSVFSRLGGNYNAIVVVGDRMFTYRSKSGTFPLCIGSGDDGMVVSPETGILDKMNHFRHSEDAIPGSLYEIRPSGINRTKVFEPEPGYCARYLVFYALDNSMVFDGTDIYEFRDSSGMKLAGENGDLLDLESSVVSLDYETPIAALGFSNKSGIPLDRVFHIDSRVGKIHDTTQKEDKETRIRRKYYPIESRVRGKRIYLVTDALREGKEIIIKSNLLKEAGADKVMGFVASPPTIRECEKGKHFKVISEGLRQQREHLQSSGLDDVRFLSKEGLMSGQDGSLYCTGCFADLYPGDF